MSRQWAGAASSRRIIETTDTRRQKEQAQVGHVMSLDERSVKHIKHELAEFDFQHMTCCNAIKINFICSMKKYWRSEI